MPLPPEPTVLPAASRLRRRAGDRPPVPVVILGATGYVAGELLRLIGMHPRLVLGAAVSRSRAGEPLARVFPHLQPLYPNIALASEADFLSQLRRHEQLAVFSATPHAETAMLVVRWMAHAEEHDCTLHWVDLSADFRLKDTARWASLYGIEHPAPDWVQRFTCDLPELRVETPPGPIAHPGCFSTAVSLACAPLHARGLCEPSFQVSAVTGATGSGRSPSPGTHHPERHADYKAYNPLRHRHVAEMEALVGAQGAGEVEIAFVPHSGPFSRGIHATVHARLRPGVDVEQARREVADFYDGQPFVVVGDQPPRLKDVVGTNLCRLGVFGDGDRLVVASAIDNLTKGAAGGALQWMNRLLNLEPTLGLPRVALGWS